MGSRERKRADRQKRKARSAERAAAAEQPHEDEAIAASAAAAGVAEEESQAAIARGYARAEERNRQAREQLEPLAEGERPRVVTVGAVISAVIALIFLASAVMAAFDIHTVKGADPNPIQLGLVAVICTAMAIGMWKSRYWAVLGFQTLLVFILLASAFGLVKAETIPQVIATLVLLGGSGALFYFMIRAMARIQMPSR